jgi:hypothetical protein
MVNLENNHKLIQLKMKKNTFENLMIVATAAILLIVTYLGKEAYGLIALIPFILLFLSGKLFYKKL